MSNAHLLDLTEFITIPFSQLTTKDIEYSITKYLNLIYKQLDKPLSINYNQLQQKLYLPLYKLNISWNTLLHLLSVNDGDALRALQDKYQEQLSNIDAKLSQNKDLYEAFKIIKARDYAQLNQEQQKVVDNTLQEFELNGINLSLTKQLKLGQINTELDKLAIKFDQNYIDSTLSYSLKLSKQEVQGIPEYLLSSYSKEGEYYVINLQDNSYHNCLRYINKRSIRKTIYQAHITLASEYYEPWDNTPIIKRILKLKALKAKLLGANNYTQLASRLKMASGTEVEHLITTLIDKALPQAKLDLATLTTFAKSKYKINQIRPWDLAYISEKYQQYLYDYSSEQIKQYFPLPAVLQGLFDLLHQLFNINFVANYSYESWHKDVLCYDIYSEDKHIAIIYLDLIERPNKQSGAWMNGARDKYTIKYQDHILRYEPQAYVVCNFSPTATNTPNLLSLDDVQTLFHEMGHTLHHCLTTIEEYSIAGINNVEFDAIELPSQLLENFVWKYDIITNITKHIDTQQSLPESLYNKIRQSRLYLNSFSILRQCELALFDFKLHQQNTTNYLNLAKQTAKFANVFTLTANNRYPNTFSHIFTSSYAASYYSYKWAEVLALDIYYTKFGTCDINDYPALGVELLDNLFSVGSLNSMQVNYQNLMHRPPELGAMLKHNALN